MENDKNKAVPRNELSDQIDSAEDREKLEEITVGSDLPDLEDLADEEITDVQPPAGRGGVTASSDDEEGVNVPDETANPVKEEVPSDVTKQEKELLFRAANDSPGDDQNLREAALDRTDNDGTPLNEDSFNKNISPSDLDVPGAELDDAEERIGEEDEENNPYSLGGDRHADDAPEDQF